MEILTLLLVFFVAILAGFFAAWLYFSSKLNRVKETSAAALLQWQKEMNVAENKHVVATETLRLKTEELNKLYQENDKLTQTADERGMELAGLQIANANLMEKLQTQKQELEVLHKRLTSEFENIASRILKKKQVISRNPVIQI